MPKQVVIYARISEDRSGERAGVERQLLDCRELAQRLGLEVIEEAVDNDVSAWAGKARPGWKRVLTLIKDKQVSAVIGWHPDRLYRRLKDLIEFVDLVEANHIDVHTVMSGRIDLTTADGRFQARLGAILAERESDHKAERITRAHKELAEQGKPKGGRRPFGYMPDQVTIWPEEAEAIREAARMLLEGQTMAAAARRVDKMLAGVPDLNKKGEFPRRPKDPRALRDTLLQPRIAGYRQHWSQQQRTKFKSSRAENPTSIPMSIPWDLIYETSTKATWEPILDEQTWHRVRAVLLDPERLAGRLRRPRKSMLGGLLRCGVCLNTRDHNGERVIHHLGYNAKSYSCNKCGKVAITVPAAERLISTKVRESLARSPQEIPDDALATAPDNTSKVAELDNRERVLIEQYTAGRLSESALGSGLDQLKRDRDRLTEEDRLTHQRLLRQQQRAELLPEWDAGDDLLKRHIISLVADYFIVVPARKKGRTFEPGRVFVKWHDQPRLQRLGPDPKKEKTDETASRKRKSRTKA